MEKKISTSIGFIQIYPCFPKLLSYFKKFLHYLFFWSICIIFILVDFQIVSLLCKEL